MTKKKLAKELLKGKKMTSDDFTCPDETYVVFNTSYDNPFRFVDTRNKTGNTEMLAVWRYTNWREVLEQSKDYGWRLPTIKELLTLVNYEKVKPTCDLVDTTSYYYWSSSTYDSNTSYAWGVYFGSGYTRYGNKYDNDYVRCVRDTPTGLEWSKSSAESMTWNEAFEYAKTLTDDDVYKG